MASHRREHVTPAAAARGRKNGKTAARNHALLRAGGGGAGTSPRVRVRMYRQGLGDCFLVTFQPDTGQAAHVLIDIGTLGVGKGVAMERVVEDIAKVTGGRLAAAIATHEHADHLSGFQRLKEKKVTAEEVWVAWTEDPTDPLAREIARYKGDLFFAAEKAAVALEAAPASAALLPIKEGLRELMAFNGFDAKEDRTLSAADRKGGLKKRLDEMMRSAQALSTRSPLYWSPGDVFEREWAPGVRFYALGPPRSRKAIGELGEHGSPDLYELALAAGVKLPARAGAQPDDETVASWEPFDREFMIERERASMLGGIAEAYAAEPWRHIDETRLGAAAELALQLDNATNNTSLVLAIEVGDEVLLFPGDAQLGSWRTWQDVEFEVRDGTRDRKVKGKELLQRTTFYKVGHHGSHNATAISGLEIMGERGLTAFIPLDEGVARRKHWPMPARKLLARLQEKTHGRVVQSDIELDGERPPDVEVTDSYVEVTLPRRQPRAAVGRAPRAEA